MTKEEVNKWRRAASKCLIHSKPYLIDSDGNAHCIDCDVEWLQSVATLLKELAAQNERPS